MVSKKSCWSISLRLKHWKSVPGTSRDRPGIARDRSGIARHRTGIAKDKWHNWWHMVWGDHFLKKKSAHALLVWDRQCLKESKRKDDFINQSINPRWLQTHHRWSSTNRQNPPIQQNHRNTWISYALQNLESPKKLWHSLFYDWEHHLQPLGLGGVVKIFSQRIYFKDVWSSYCKRH